METLKKNKNLIIAAAVFALLMWAYTAFFKTDGSTPTDVNAQNVGSEVLALYDSLNSVSLDQSIFASPLYKNLTDFSTALQVQQPGRPNPFDTIGRD